MSVYKVFYSVCTVAWLLLKINSLLKSVFYKTLRETGATNKFIFIPYLTFGMVLLWYVWQVAGNIPLHLLSLVLNRGLFQKSCLQFPALDAPWFFIEPKIILSSYLGPMGILFTSMNVLALFFGSLLVPIPQEVIRRDSNA